MAEINLLQNTIVQEKAQSKTISTTNRIGVTILVLVFLASAAFFALDMISAKQVVSETADQTQKISQITAEQGYPEMIKTQAKISDLKTLIGQHVDWSKIMPKFFSTAYKNTRFNKFTATGDGSLTVGGDVDTFADLDLLIQGLQLGDAKNCLNDIKLQNVGLSSSQDKVGISFVLKLTYNKNLIKTVAPGNSSGSDQAKITASDCPVLNSSFKTN